MSLTTDLYRAPSALSGVTTSPDLLGVLSRLSNRVGYHWIYVAERTTGLATLIPAEADDEHARLLRSLAERSLREDNGLDRDVLNNIDREAWGIE